MMTQESICGALHKGIWCSGAACTS